MDCKSLMIGDWVKYGKEYFQVDGSYRITNTLFLKYNGHTAHYKDGCVVAEDSEPIPLTEEILKANGFFSFGEDYYYEVKERNSTFKLYRQYGSTWYITICSMCQYMYYVHELQHALRSCGLNELADNFKVE